MKKLLIISERFWPEGGGAELATYLITKILSKRYDITLVTGTKNYKFIKGVRIIYMPQLGYRTKAILWAMIIKNKGLFEKLISRHDIVYIPRFSFPIVPLAKRLHKTVIVHLHDYVPISYTANILAPYEQHKYKIKEDDILMECSKDFKHCIGVSFLWWLPRLVRKWIHYADKIICVSKRHAEIINDAIPELRPKVKVIYNPPPPVPPIEKKLSPIPTLIFPGGDSYIKGFHIFFKAVRIVLKKGYRPISILTGSYNTRVRNLIEKANKCYGGVFRLMGRIKYELVLNLHKIAWALILPSLCEETMGYAIVESMFLGTIPVASKVGGIPEVVKDTPAEKMLFTPGDPTELGELIESILGLTPEQLKALETEIKKSISRKFSLYEVERRLIQEIEE